MLVQDLTYLNGKLHTSTYEAIYTFEEINGYILKTTSGYIYFKEQIERLIEINKEVKFIIINCSKGPFIEGSEHIEFEKYINEVLDY